MSKRIAIILTSSLLIAACGSSSGNSGDSKSPSKGYSQALQFSKCMRSHGVSNFPDPTPGGGGIHISIGPNSGVNPRSPAFQSAQTSCARMLPGGGPGSGPPSPQAKAQMLAVSKCMRAHGISGFPDPITTQPSSIENYGLVMGRDGVFLALPKSLDVSSPAFKQAAVACNFGPPGGVPAARK